MTRLKNRIRRDAGLFGGRFVSRTLLEEGRSPLDSQACICFFPGSQPDVLWNALIRTAREAFWDAVREQAYGEAVAILGPQEAGLEIDSLFEPLPGGGRRLRQPRRYEAFGGLTLGEKIEHLSEQIICERPPVIREAFTTHEGYLFGTGLTVIVDVPVIDRRVVEQVMDRFFALGERSWAASEPVPADRLPSMTQRKALEQAAEKGSSDAE